MRAKLLFLALALSAGLMAANTTTTQSSRIRSAVTVSANTDYVLTLTSNLFGSSGSINIPSDAMEHSVIIFQNIKPSVVISSWLRYVKINGSAASNGTNCQVKMYDKGAIVLPYSSSFQPLTCYTGTNFTGSSYSGYTTGSNGGYMRTLTTAQLKNNFKSFKLKRGYMVTFATGESGWGYSRCFIAATEDLEVDLPPVLAGKVSSYRLFHWYNFGKSGIANDTRSEVCNALNVQSAYTYGVGQDLRPDVECIPHKIHKNWPGVADCGSCDYSAHMKTDNEPANGSDDTPATVAEVLNYWQDAMRTGMRLCAPSSHDGGYAWQEEFMNAIDDRGWRCDVLDMHCYWVTNNFPSLANYYNKFHRPIWVTEWLWGASWSGGSGMFSGNPSDQTINSETSTILGYMNSYDYVERYHYWNGESKGHIYESAVTSPLGQTYAATDGGLGYKAAMEFVPVVVINKPYSFSCNASGNNVSLSWKDKNGDMVDEIRVQYKDPNTTTWTTLTTVSAKEKTSSSDQSYTFSGTVDNADSYDWRVVNIFDNKEYSCDTPLHATEPIDDTDILPANLSEFYFQFYSKEANADLVWAVTASGEDRVQYKAKASDLSTDPYQIWILEPNTHGGYSLRNVGEIGYLIASPASWNFITRNNDYTVEAAQTAFDFVYNSDGDYWICKNLAHPGNYVGLWDNDKRFAAGEVLAGNRDSEATADHIGIRIIPRSAFEGGIDVSPSDEATVGQSYYIYNVDAGKFLTAGNSYGTHASLGSSGLLWTLGQDVSSGLCALKCDNGYLYATDQDGLWVDGAESVSMTYTGGDVTSAYLTNADFSSGTPATGKIYGYGKDGSPYGYQAFTDWTPFVVNGDNSDTAYPNSGMAGGLFSYGSTTAMLRGGGKTPPSAGPNGESGQCLGVLGVWGCGGYYYQTVTLPAGSYTISYTVYNQSGTTTINKSYFGFIANNGTEYLSSQRSFATGSWITVTANFTLTASTTGKICIGYRGADSGSEANPHLFIDKVTISKDVQSFVSHTTQHTRFFTLTKGSDDSYTLQVDPENTYLGTAALGDGRYVGFVGDIGNTPYVLTAPKASYHSGVGSKWLFMSPKAYNIYRMGIVESAAYRQQMWPLVIAARAAGVGSEEIGVYEDPTSTSSQITAAMASLREKILTLSATETSPVDYSFFITNGDCASSSFEGWTSVGSWGSHTTFYHNGDALLTNRFTESWVDSQGALADRTLSQTLTNLPDGNYQLSLDVVATRQNNPSLAVTGVTLFLGDKEVSCSTADGVPQTFVTPAFTVSQGASVTLGFKLSGTNANWVAFDNFRLAYFGPASIKGDANNDGQLDFADVPAVISIILGNDSAEPHQYDHVVADMDGNGEITLADLTALINLLLSTNE